MNTPSPLVPQGTIPARGKSTVFFKVLMILTVHVVLIGGMLLQGCKDTKDNSAIQPAPDTTPATVATTDSVPPVATTSSISNAVTSNAPQNIAQTPAPAAAQPQPMPASAPIVQPAPMPAPAAAAPPATSDTREYAIAKGDTLGALAKKNGVSLKAMLAANPGIDPKKLKVGQKVQIPAGAGGSAATGAADASASGDTTSYTVKSGDTLGKIAKMNHTTYKKIMALNDLKTTSIKVGQKIKLPAGAEAPAAAAAPAPVQPMPLPAPIAPVAAPSTTASN
jgi:LysM repeat protein